MARLVAEASRDVAQQRDQLAALMAELNQSVVVCNLDGRILLYNERARQLFRRLSTRPPGAGGAELIGLGRSIYGVIDRALIAHALETVERAHRPGRRRGYGVGAVRDRHARGPPAAREHGAGAPGVRRSGTHRLRAAARRHHRRIRGAFAARPAAARAHRGEQGLLRQHAGRARHARLPGPRRGGARPLPDGGPRRGVRHERAARRARREHVAGSDDALAAAGNARGRPARRGRAPDRGGLRRIS